MIKSNSNSSTTASSSHSTGSSTASPSSQTVPTSSLLEASGSGVEKKKGWEVEDAIKERTAAEPPIVAAKSAQPTGLATPATSTNAASFSLASGSLRRILDIGQKEPKISNPSYQQLHDVRVEEFSRQSSTASGRIEQVLALRKQGLESVGDAKHSPVPNAGLVNQLRHHRSMDSSLDELKKDPTLTVPARSFPLGINSDPVDKLPFLQRPGAEVRINSVNKEKLITALTKHGTHRKANLQGEDLNIAVHRLMSERGLSSTEAQERARTQPFTGGWDKPLVSPDKTKPKKGEDGPTKKLLFGRASSLAKNINWDPQTWACPAFVDSVVRPSTSFHALPGM